MKQISGKQKKTDADFEEMARIEWYASLYLDKNRVCLPSEVLEAVILGGARKLKLGKQVQAGVFVADNAILEFDGSTMTIDELWERDQNRFTVGVRVGKSKVMRTRFRVDEWSAAIEVLLDDEMLNPAQIEQILAIAGHQVGLCDWRPKFGRFAAEAA